MPDRERRFREHVAFVLAERRQELASKGQALSYEEIARRMGEFGKEAVVRLVAQERPITVALVERLARALELDPVVLLEPILGPSRTREEVQKRLDAESELAVRTITTLGAAVINDPHAVDALRALAAIDDKQTRRAVAEVVLAVARDYERMTGARRLLVGPTGRRPPGEGGPKRKR